MTHCSDRTKRRITTGCALLMAPLTAAGLAACSSGGGKDPLAGSPYQAGDGVAVNAVGSGGTLDPDKPLEVTAKDGGDALTDVLATDVAGRALRGELSADGQRWRSTSPLAAGVRYTVSISTENGEGAPGRRVLHFETKPAGKKLTVAFGPKQGRYGVGQPITAELSHRVKSPAQRDLVERALKVRTKPWTEGAWHWVDGKELHYRPRDYWPAHATVRVHSALEGLKVRKGLYGGSSKPLSMSTGDRVEAVADAGSLEMKFKKNGKVVKSFPITTGKSGFETRNGIKVVLGRESFVRMTSGSIGIAAGSSDSYDLPVHWATRLTNSGEYVHGAPWSTGDQGVSNVSHGCTGMSTEDARWFFDNVRQGDLVEHVNTAGEDMAPFGNGFGDWNMEWKDWVKGSAVQNEAQQGGAQGGTARLRPQV
nr:Ig-like domain-containing protein [Streptomyces sulphureus]